MLPSRTKKQVLNGREKVKVAVVQSAPIFLDKEKSVEKACKLIREAGRNGAELITFSEAWISGYPYWGEGWESNVEKWLRVRIQFQDNSLIIPSEDTDRLCEAAAAVNSYVVIGCDEMDPRPQSRTVYNTLLFIGRRGEVLGRHRKLMPTYVERAFWGWGNASDLVVFETDIGRISGLICGEHLMTLVRAALIQKGEEFHVAVFPGSWNHEGPRLEEPDKEGYFFGHSSIRAHALEAGSFVLSGCGYITDSDIPADFPHRDRLNIDYAQGGSSIITPMGTPLVKPQYGETILYAECKADIIKAQKAIIDTVGHYSRPDVVQLKILASPEENQLTLAKAVERLSGTEVKRIAEKHGVSVEKLEAMIEEICEQASDA